MSPTGNTSLTPIFSVTVAELNDARVAGLVRSYRAQLITVAAGAAIPGSYWGAPEAGLVADRLYARLDTPAHSLLHELSHYVCMTAARRACLTTDAGGDTDEECAVCYLQILLADEFAELGRDQSFADMDAWGYSFREGSAASWFAGDGRAARVWLIEHGLIDQADKPTWRLRA